MSASYAEGCKFESYGRNKMWFSSMVERYPDTVKVIGSNPITATKIKCSLLSMEEGHHYKVVGIGSNPVTATNWFVTQLARVPVFYTGSCEFESHRANRNK